MRSPLPASIVRRYSTWAFLILAASATACDGGNGDNPCQGVDCSLHGACLVVLGQARCDCDPGFVSQGLVCHADHCADRICYRGLCVQNAETAACECEAGWAGEDCDSCAVGYHPDNGECAPDAPCLDNPCIHGQCREEGGQEICDCDAGYAGELCDTCAAGYHAEGLSCVPDENNPCAPNPCQEDHRGVCLNDGAGGYTCGCDTGYHDEAGACVPDGTDPCLPNPCQEDHRGVCQDDGAGGFSCGCDTGYHDEAGVCVPDGSDPCLPNPCGEDHRGVCLNDGAGGYTCACDSGYHDEAGVCVPDGGDPCLPNPCQDENRGVCQDDGAGAYTCSCDPGYHEQAEACLPDCDVDGDLCSAAHASFGVLVSGNGHGVVGYDVTAGKADSFLEHVYRNWDEGVSTRDLLYDSYLGVRTAGSHLWLNDLAPLRVEYLDQSGIIHLVHRLDGFRIDTYLYAPWNLSRPALVLIGQITNENPTEASASLYTLHNYHLGNTSAADPVNPDAADEVITHQASSGAYLETGPGGIMLHQPLGTPSHHGCSPDNPWQALSSGQDLADTAASGAAAADRVAGFQRDFTLAPGAAGWFGAVSAFERFAGQQAGLIQDVQQAFAGLDAQTALAAARAEFEAWRTTPPAGLSPAELMIWRQSEAVLRQGQVWEETDLSLGQIVASMPPGNWNICWMRDMAYAIVALSRTGHFQEARAALAFVLLADSGYYEAGYVGVPYQVTITRYFGRGKEETDSNQYGPNIEYDGFGLFLWALGIYVAESGDTTLLDDHWAVIRDEIAGALVALIDGTTGLIAADSSIWEVHWDGQQKRFGYTSLAAARGLCAAAQLAADRGEDVLANAWQTSAIGIRDALYTHCLDGDSVLASSYEELQAGSGHYDVASVEAFNWLLFDPAGAVGLATLDSFVDNLQVASGRGYFRNDDGGWYDSQEWVYADLRASVANRRAGRVAVADRLLDWITAQALYNHGMIAELHEPSTSDYEGEIPMVGYGGGAYILALLERIQPAAADAFCGGFEGP